MKSSKIKNRILIPLTLTLAFLLSAFVLSAYRTHQKDIHEDVAIKMESVQELFRTILDSDAAMMAAALEVLKRDNQLQVALGAKDRKALLKRSATLFERLRSEFQVTHFYFSAPDRVNILRVHKPDKYGDVINRFTTLEAAKTGKLSYGIELGPLGTFTLRAVVPWRDGERLVGYVELGKEIEHITHKLHDGFGVELYVIIAKKYLNRENWESGMRMLDRKGKWDQFSSLVIVNQTLDIFPEDLVPFLIGEDNTHDVPYVMVTLNGQAYCSRWYPLKDASGRELGDMVIMSDVTDRLADFHAVIFRIVATCIAVGVVLFVFFNIFLGRVERKLEKSTGKLKLEIDKHQRMAEVLRKAHDELELRVEERTIELVKANEQLKKEIEVRKLAEKTLRESKEQYKELYKESKRAEQVYRSLLHSSADAIVIYDFEGRAKYISPAFSQLFGWTFEEVKGQKIPFLPESETEATMAIIKELVENGTPCHGFETKRYTKDGNVLDVSISASRYADHEGNPAGTLVILRDISERKRLEAQLQHAQRMEAIGTLAGGIAHDFNNLLMGMLGNISLMLHDTEPRHPHYDMLRNIEKMIQSGSKLTSQLLGYARKGIYEVKPINLNRVVNESSGTFGRVRKEITIHTELAGDLLAVEADEAQVEQALVNLYVNAAAAMPGGGDLLLKTKNVTHKKLKDKPYAPKPGNYVMLKVKDNGTGMDEKTMARIFDPFFTTKEMGRGTGLGLASTYGIIKGHGGYIDVDSKKGLGTSFSIYLPASDKTIKKTCEVAGQIIEGYGTILLVDDEDMIIDIGVKMLKKFGYTVIEARSGREAIEVYKENKDKIDLVILDMIMPVVGGGEAYDKMKAIDPKVKVLLSSGYSIDGQATEILDRGCSGFIQKPFSMKELSQKIREILDSLDI